MNAQAGRAHPARSFPRSVTLFRYRGVPVRLDWSWAIIAALVAWLVHGHVSGELAEPDATIAAAAVTVAFFASILIHELGHCHTNLDRDLPVSSVTLFLLGGVTESTREASTARDDFVIVAAGPFLSFALAGAFGLAATAVGDAQPYAMIFGLSAWLNLALAVFNVLPGFPLDGGRLLRAVLWGVTKRPHTATRWAARVGQAFAVGLGLLGVRALTVGDYGGVWLLLIALFLFRGAADAHRQAKVRDRYTGRRARDVMGSVPAALDPGQPLHYAVRTIEAKPSLLWPVGEPLLGAVRLADLEAVPRRDWAHTTVGDVTRPGAAVTVAADATMDVALAAMSQAPGNMMLVVDDAGRPVGLLTPSLVVDAG